MIFTKFVKYVIVVQFMSIVFISTLFSQLLPPIGEKELVNDSTHIAIGTVTKLECFWFQHNRSKIICTKVFIEPENVIKGKLDKNEMVIYTPVGSLDGIETRIVGAPEYEIGERVLVFCDIQKEGYFKNYASYLGKKTIKGDLIVDENITLQKYISKIRNFMMER